MTTTEHPELVSSREVRTELQTINPIVLVTLGRTQVRLTIRAAEVLVRHLISDLCEHDNLTPEQAAAFVVAMLREGYRREVEGSA